MFVVDHNDPPQRWFWEWTGDLDDDCTAVAHGLMLRAEQMHRRNWWWAVYADEGRAGCEQLAASYDAPPHHATSGADARAAAEMAARRILQGY